MTGGEGGTVTAPPSRYRMDNGAAGGDDRPSTKLAGMTMAKRGTPWTPERDRTLLMLKRLGFRPTQIMQMLGGVTRNAVIGRYYRLQPNPPVFGFVGW